jgi:hypothetical protein
MPSIIFNKSPKPNNFENKLPGGMRFAKPSLVKSSLVGNQSISKMLLNNGSSFGGLKNSQMRSDNFDDIID